MKRKVMLMMIGVMAALCGIASAGTSFVEDFEGGTIGSNLQQMDTDGTGLVVEAGQVHAQWGYRRYVATVDSDYNLSDWTFDIDINAQHTESSEGIAFIGFGSAGRDVGYYDVPLSDNSYVQLGEGGGGGAINFSAPAVGGTEFGWSLLGGNGLKHVRLTKAGSILTYEVDADYVAGAFTSDWTKVIDITGNWNTYDATNSRLFFGTYSNGTYFDNVSVAVVPEPCTLALLGIGSLVAVRRRK